MPLSFLKLSLNRELRVLPPSSKILPLASSAQSARFAPIISIGTLHLIVPSLMLAVRPKLSPLSLLAANATSTKTTTICGVNLAAPASGTIFSHRQPYSTISIILTATHHQIPSLFLAKLQTITRVISQRNQIASPKSPPMNQLMTLVLLLPLSTPPTLLI